jgi:hypothetical protein
LEACQEVAVVRVRWEDLERTPLFEDLVSVLISRLDPNAERIDGAGGDGGRDVQLRTPERLEIFELKSFTGRLGRQGDRRRQVEESLRTAAAHQPDQWSLVVPIDHNPAELRWFDGLRARYDFPLVWHGRGWLDGQMAASPDVHRYYLEDAKDEVFELLRELNAEQATLTGVEDAVVRLGRLRARLNELDPQYRFELTSGPAEVAMAAFPNAVMFRQQLGEQGPVTVSVVPKYRNAERDRPILINTNLLFPDTEVAQEAADQFRAFLDFGDPALIHSEFVQDIVVDAPGGLGGQLGPGTLRVGPARTPDFALDARLHVTDEAGNRLASLPVRFTQRRGGQRGDVITGQDATGIVQISLQFDKSAQQVKIDVRVRPAHGRLPSTLVHPLRFGHALRAPHRFTATIADQDLWLAPQSLPDLELVPTEYLRLVEDLARIQAEANTPFPLPDQIEAEDVAALARLVRLFDGEGLPVIAKPITFTPTPDAPPLWLTGKDEPGFLAVEATCSQTLMGEEIPLGMCHFVIRGPWQAEELPGSKVRLVPIDGRVVLRRGGLPR